MNRALHFMVIVLFIGHLSTRGQNGINLPQLSIQLQANQGVRLAWANTAVDFVLEETRLLSPVSLWTPVSQTPLLADTQFTMSLEPANAARFFRLRLATLTTIGESSPANGEQGVAVTRETVLRFTRPLAPNSALTGNHLHAGFAGRRLLSRVELSTDRRSATLFYLEPMPGSTRVSVVFDATGLTDASGLALDPDADGIPGGRAVLTFDTLSTTPVAGTAVVGRVFASELIPGPKTNSVNRPLQGVTITVDGMEETLRAVTDGNGNFRLEPAPAGRFFVHIDGRTVTNLAAGIRYPDLAYYPFVGKAWEGVPGRATPAGGTGEIYLPLITTGTLQPVSMVQDTPITFPPSIIANDPALAGVTITVPSNSLYGDNGARGGKVGIAPVPPDRLPERLPPGLEFPLVITVQTDGMSNFDRPVPACFPNLPNPITGQPLPAGTDQWLYSFNHDTGHFEPVAPMTVSADGRLICTDSGVGILQPGWHGSGEPPIVPGPHPKVDLRPTLEECAEFAKGTSPPPLLVGSCYRHCIDEQEYRERRCRGVFVYRIIACDRDRIKLIEQGSNFDECMREAKAEEARCLAAESGRDEACKARCRTRYCPNDFDESGEPLNRNVVPQAANSIEDNLHQILDEISALVQPLIEAQISIPTNIQAQVSALLAQADAMADGDALAFLTQNALQAERALVAEGEPLGNAPNYPVLYAALIERPSGPLTIRGQTGPDGEYALFVPRDGQLISVRFYDPLTKGFDIIFPYLRPEARYLLPRFTLTPRSAEDLDVDHDGLPDLVESVYGTDPVNTDSDGDGVNDGAEVEQGTNPLDGFPAATGVIASAPTLGPAIDVAAFNNILIVAEGSSGVGLFNVFNGMNPTLVAQIDTPGSAQAVAFSGGLAAVADADAGLAILDIADPAKARIVHQLALGSPVRAVTTAGPLAYAGLFSGEVVAVDMISGTQLGRVLTGPALQDVALGEDYLYVLTAYKLFAISLEEGGFRLAGSVNAPGTPLMGSDRRMRLFVGGGLAYAVDTVGYSTFNLANQAAPVLAVRATSPQVGWKQMVANGSGLGVAAVGNNRSLDGPHDISLYDLSRPTNNNLFITTFVTPGVANSVSIFNGLAYVADSAAGLQVVNYREYDRLRQPPTISLATQFAPGLAEEGKLTRVSASVSDDVQVRNVEFYVDGRLVATDGNFPFEVRFITPLRTQQSDFTLRARATDTGGNATWTDSLTLTLVDDATAPRVTSTTPPDNSIIQAGTVFSLGATFDEPLNSATVIPFTFRLFAAGADGIAGNGDDIALTNGTLVYRADLNAAFLSFPDALPAGVYRAVVSPPIANLAQSQLAADFGWTFVVRAPVSWIRDGDGFWDDPANWSGGSVPQANDVVVLDRPGGNYTITFRAGNVTLTSLQSEEALAITGGTLTLNRASTVNNDFTLNGGTLDGAGDLTIAGQFTWLAGTLRGNGRTLPNGGLLIDGGSNKTLHGRTLENVALVIWRGTSGISGADGGTINNLVGATLDIQSDASLSYGCCLGAMPTLNNAGTLRKSVGSGATAFTSVTFNNTGVVQIQSGTLEYYGNSTGTSTGNFHSESGTALKFLAGTFTLNEGVTFTGAGIHHVVGATLVVGGAVTAQNFEFAGTLRGPGTFTATGVFNWLGGNLIGPGTMALSPGAMLNISGGAIKTLNGNVLNNAGLVTWSGSGQINGINGAVVNNLAGATFDAQSDTVFGYDFLGDMPAFNNGGTFRKSGGPGATTFGRVKFTNTGTVELKKGTVSFVGGVGFTQTATGILVTDIAGLTAGTEFGRLTLGGLATLAGTLHVNLVEGYEPNLNDLFHVLSFSSRAGEFTTLNGLLIGNAKTFQVNYSDSAVTFEVVLAP